MGVNVTSGKVTSLISGAVAVNYPVPDMSTIIPTYAFLATTSGVVQTIYTVPAGKRFFLYAIYRTNPSSTGLLQLYATDGTTEILRISSNIVAGPEYSQFLSLAIPIATYAAGEFVKIKEASTDSVSVFGLLVTV